MAAGSASSSSSSSSSSESDSEIINRPPKRNHSSSESDSDSSDSSNESEIQEKPKKLKRKSTPIPPKNNEDDSSSDEETSESEEEEEVQVLSHKAQRRMKKKENKLAKSALTDADSSEPAKSKDKKKGKKEKANADKDAQQKRQNSVWVGNLSFKTTPDSLRSFFDGVGEITRINMPMKVGPAKNENRGFAYVDFATPDAKTIAITMSENHLEGRKLLIKDGNDFTGRPAAPVAAASADNAAASQGSTQVPTTGLTKSAQKILASQKQPPCPCLFLGNLGFEATDEKIRQMIEGHAKALAKRGKSKEKGKGKEKSEKEEDAEDTEDAKMEVDDGEESVDTGIKKVRMGTFEDSGLCKGFAFVDFTSTMHATAALTNPRNHFLDGRKLVVEYASADAARRGGYREAGVGKTNGGRGAAGGRQKSRDDTDGAPRKKRRTDGEEEVVDGADENENTQEYSQRTFGKPKRDERNGRPRPERRSKPGAALALAKRESVAIVPSQGTRLTFT